MLYSAHMKLSPTLCGKCFAEFKGNECPACAKRKASVERVQQWRRDNEDYYREKKREHYTNNKEQYADRVKKRREALELRTPKWLTDKQLQQINDFYKRAKKLKQATGIDYHVDHIVPLQGELVSGLNVPWNLQLLSADDNDGKGVKFDPDSPDNIGPGMQPQQQQEYIEFKIEEQPLSYSEESFCTNYVRYGDARRAYRESFSQMPTTEALDALSNDKRVIDRIMHIRLVLRESAEFTLTEHLMNMAMLRDQAVRKGDMKAAIQAEKCRGEVVGFYAKNSGESGGGTGISITANLLPQVEGIGFTDSDSGVTISVPSDDLARVKND